MDAPHSSSLSPTDLARAAAAARERLLAERTPEGRWTGALSSSALSTATAITALALADPVRHGERISRGLEWLSAHASSDGGWGDTARSPSNISTTTLCWGAFGAAAGAGVEGRGRQEAAVGAAEAWLRRAAGDLAPEAISRAIAGRYGRDRTFSAPILTLAAAAGRLSRGRDAWRHVIPLPFELAAFPRRWFAGLRLPVVSYALPALIAIGLARHAGAPSRNPVARLARSLATGRTLRVLEEIQPSNGGFLEATPLTSFVTIGLVAAGRRDHPVVRRSVAFLEASARADGSWPIDTNLSTWLTTLSVHAIAASPAGLEAIATADRERLASWIIGQQTVDVHRYTLAAPGAWAWTDLPGGVPDADDTAGALVALRRLAADDPRALAAAASGVRWLLDLQNRDGGVPTFCRGWGLLPFDRSSADLTAHALRAWAAWRADLPAETGARLDAASRRAAAFLASSQRRDGAWIPLWFGNALDPREENPTYGTARVVLGLADSAAPLGLAVARPLERGAAWLLGSRNPDGGWGGGPGIPSTVEETAVAVEALAAYGAARPDAVRGAASPVRSALEAGGAWLVANAAAAVPSPIGFYFARLWYFERLYPAIFTAAALGRLETVHSDLSVR